MFIDLTKYPTVAREWVEASRCLNHKELSALVHDRHGVHHLGYHSVGDGPSFLVMPVVYWRGVADPARVVVDGWGTLYPKGIDEIWQEVEIS